MTPPAAGGGYGYYFVAAAAASRRARATAAQSLAFRTEHDDQRIGLETGFADQLIAAAV